MTKRSRLPSARQRSTPDEWRGLSDRHPSDHVNLTGQPVALRAGIAITRDTDVKFVAAAPGAPAPTSEAAPVGAALDLPAHSIAVAGVAKY